MTVAEPVAQAAAQAAHTYSLRHVQTVLGLRRGAVERLVDAGFVTPARGPRNQYRFSFQDIILLRTAHALREADIAPRKLLQSLRELVQQLPAELPLSGLRIQAVGGAVVARHSGVDWEPLTGQLTLDFEVHGGAGGAVSVLNAKPAPGSPTPTAQDWLARGTALEASDRSAAEQAYRQALQLDPALAAAAINLGALLCEDGRCHDAVQMLDAATAVSPQDSLLHFNRAIALEDVARLGDATVAYSQALALDPDFADAHYNLARLHQRLGAPLLAIRHYGAYRRLGAGAAPAT